MPVRIRKIPATIGAVSGVFLYEMSEHRTLSHVVDPLYITESGRHFLPGLIIGGAIKLACVVRRTRNDKALIYATTSGGIAGTLFETGIFDHLYRQNTASLPDIAVTTFASLIGALCVSHSDAGEQ